MDLPPEILILVKTSPWAFAACFITRQLLNSPFATILAIRLARNARERTAFLADRHIECRPVRLQSRRNRCERKGEP